jgi:UDP-N-acetylglucosamine 2-epimerase
MGDLLKKWVAMNYIPKFTEESNYILPKHYFLATIHRPANTDNVKNLTQILTAFSLTDKDIVFPVHPRTERFIKKYSLEEKLGKNIHMMKPVSYFDFLWLEENALKIITDSGGIQKEAYMLKVPCITLRDTTEWVETVTDGWNILVGSDKEKIIDAINNFNPRGKQHNLFGDGHTNS